jgi:DNA-binding CsgD family transcriptional regulator
MDVAGLNEEWTRPSRALEAVERILSEPRVGVLTGFSSVIADLVPHRAAAMRTADCPREPVKLAGDTAITELVTSAELAHLAERAAPGAAVADEGVLAGSARPLVIAASADGTVVLVLVPTATPTEPALELLARLWNVLSLNANRKAIEVPAADFPSNLAIAAARSRAIADMEQTHAVALSGLLSVLRSSRLSDAVARRDAEQLAVDALLELRASSVRDNELSALAADDAFAALAADLAPMIRHADTSVELSGPDDTTLLPRDLTVIARDLTEALVLSALERTGTTRVHASWRLRDGALHVAVRDDGSGADTTPGVAGRTAERVEAVGGRIEADSIPGWGTTVTAVFPLGMEESPDAAPIDGLHARELEVLSGLAEGMRNREIAQRLRLSEHTVKFHVRNILAKLGVSTRGQAAAVARGRLESGGR